MTKGHNKEITKDRYPENKGKGQDRKQTDQKKDKSRQGRNSDPDPSGGRKGKNNVS